MEGYDGWRGMVSEGYDGWRGMEGEGVWWVEEYGG